MSTSRIAPRPDDADSGRLDGLTFAAGLPAEDPPAADPLLGQTVGGVVLVRVIADGGMGRVYEGQQGRPRRVVAVKTLRPGLASAADLKRFEYEAQVLGSLRHPGIAHVYAFGTHPSDAGPVPYFVMEFIPEAKTIVEYAADDSLPRPRRLELFRAVCEAVAHGHRKGVVHRDLKPRNILVDASGQPKVIDFGVARSAEVDAASTTLLADAGQVVGTLQYMSPEQFAGDSVDVRADVYALGIILCELLTGRTPHELQGKTLAEAARIVTEDDVAPPSLGGLPRALAAIVGRCLEKNRGHRYADAGALAADVGRFLAGDPVTARLPSLLDSLLRVARRHRAATAALVTLAASLAVAFAGISAFWFRAEAERARAEAEGAEAGRQRTIAHDQRLLAVAAKEQAEREADSARWRLYLANLRHLEALAKGTESQGDGTLFEQTLALQPAGSMPIELRCLRPGLDRAAQVIAGMPRDAKRFVASPDGRRFAILRDDGAVAIHETSDGAEVHVLRGRGAAAQAAAFSPDGGRVVTACRDRTARLWDMSTGAEIMVLRGHAKPLSYAAFSADGRRIVAGGARTARVWDAATGAPVATIGNREGVSVAVLSPDGRQALTVCAGSYPRSLERESLRVWDVDAGTETGPVSGSDVTPLWFGWSPEGRRMFIGGFDGRGRLLDADTFAVLATVAPDRSSDGRNLGRACRFAFNPDGTRIAVAAFDTVCVLETRDGRESWATKPHPLPVACLAFSPDGSRLLAGSDDGKARLWDAATGAELAVLEGHRDAVLNVAFGGDGDRLITQGRDGTIRLWSTADCGNRFAVLRGHRGTVRGAVFSPDGRRLATVSDDGSARLWDVDTARELTVFPGRDLTVMGAAFSPDGRRLATVDPRGPRLWDTLTGTAVADLGGHRSCAFSVAFRHDGTRLATGALDGEVRLWNAVTGAPLPAWSPHDAAPAAADRREIVVADFECDSWAPWTVEGTAFGAGPVEGEARGLAGFAGRRVADSQAAGDGARGRLRSPPFRIERSSINLLVAAGAPSTACVNLVADGTVVRTAMGSGRNRLGPVSWDVRDLDGREVRIEILDDLPGPGWHVAVDQIVQSDAPAVVETVAVLQAHVPHVTDIAFSPDGSRMATASGHDLVGFNSRAITPLVVGHDSTAKVWDAATGDLRAVLSPFGGHLDAASFSPDGSRIATAAGDSARVWDVETGRPLRTLPSGPVAYAAFSPDGGRILTISQGDDPAGRVWDASTGAELASLHGLRRPLPFAAFSPDGRRIVASSQDGATRIWDAETGAALAVLDGRDMRFDESAVSPRGDCIVTWSNKAGAAELALWGRSNAEIAAARARSTALRERLRPQVDEWFSGGVDRAAEEFERVRRSLPPDEAHEAADMILERATAR